MSISLSRAKTSSSTKLQTLLSNPHRAILLLLLLWPWILIAITSDWLFLNISADDWMYFGYFNNLTEHMRRFNDTGFYYGTRLSWVLPGALVYWLFPPLVANYVLHLGLYYITVFSVYGTLARSLQQRAALLVAIMLGSYSFFLFAVGRDYVTGPGIAYTALIGYLTVRAAQSRRPEVWMGLTGAAIAAIIYTNLFCVALLPGIGLCAFLLSRRPVGVFIVRWVLPAVAGVATISVLMGLVNIALGGDFWFYRRSIDAATSISSLPKNLWIDTPPDWPVRNPHLIFPILTLIGSVIVLVVPKLRQHLRPYKAAPVFLGQYVLTAFIMIFFQLRASTPVLQAAPYAGYIIPFMFLALGVLLAPFLATLRRSTFAAIIATFGVVGLASFAYQSCWPWDDQQTTLPVLAVGLLWVLPLLALYRNSLLWIQTLLILALSASIVATPSAFLATGYNTFCVPKARTQASLQDNYQAVLKGVAAIKALAPDTPTYFWYDKKEHQIYHSLSGFFLGPWVHISERFPELGEIGKLRATLGSTIVLLSQDQHQLDVANSSLKPQGLSARMVGQQFVQQGAIKFYVTVFVVDMLPETPEQLAFLDMSAASDDYLRYLEKGWSVPEAFGSWTVGSQAQIILPREPLVAAGEALIMTFEVPYNIVTTAAHSTNSIPTVTVDVLVNGEPLDQWTLAADMQVGKRSVFVPASVLATSKDIVITLVVNKPYSPRELGFDAADTRALGVAVQSIQFTPIRW